MAYEKNLGKYRKKIDLIDQKILDRLNERSRIVLDIGKIKQSRQEKVYAPQRENALLHRLTKKNKGPFPDHALHAVFREIISASRSLQSSLKVAYLGPEATFTHLATLKYFGQSTELIPEGSIAKVFESVEKENAQCGVVPIENSTEGVVGATLDRFLDSSLKIMAEVVLPISHHLLSRANSIASIQRVYSHPQAIAQCRKWLDENLLSVPILETESTAQAAKRAAEDPQSAGIAGEHAGELYRLHILKRNIEDHPFNKTRFLVIGKNSPNPSSRDKTSILFSVKDQPGILYQMLEPFYRQKINLTKIESRPLKKKTWEYIFFLDMDGHMQDQKIKKSVQSVEKKCHFLKVLGSYPKAPNS